MKVPPELLDSIIGYVPRSSLHSCSLVTRSWTGLCQRRLFQEVRICPRNSQQWLDKISPANVELLGYVRMLSYINQGGGTLIGPAHYALREYFPSFRQLRRLILDFSHTWSLPQGLEIFSAFRHTLSIIGLVNCVTTESTFIALLNYFPNLMQLAFFQCECCREDKLLPPLSRLAFKKLIFTSSDDVGPDFIDELSKLGLHFEEVVLSEQAAYGSAWWKSSKRVISVFGEKARRVRLANAPGGAYIHLYSVYARSHYFLRYGALGVLALSRTL